MEAKEWKSLRKLIDFPKPAFAHPLFPYTHFLGSLGRLPALGDQGPRGYKGT